MCENCDNPIPFLVIEESTFPDGPWNEDALYLVTNRKEATEALRKDLERTASKMFTLDMMNAWHGMEEPDGMLFEYDMYGEVIQIIVLNGRGNYWMRFRYAA